MYEQSWEIVEINLIYWLIGGELILTMWIKPTQV